MKDMTEIDHGDEQAARDLATTQSTTTPLYKSPKVETKIFQGDYTPTQTVCMAIYSDDGCDVIIDGKYTNIRSKGKGQPLTNLGSSFKVINFIFEKGINYTIKVDYSNSYHITNTSSPLYPDLDGCTLFVGMSLRSLK